MTLRGWGIWVRFVMCDGGAAVPERCYGVAVFVICVGLRCVLATGSSRVGLPSLAPAQLVTRWGFFDFVLHPVAFVALEASGWPESPPTAMKIVKERGGSRQNTLRRVRRAFSETWIFFALVGYGAVATVVGPFP
jgi:hypothetical protein